MHIKHSILLFSLVEWWTVCFADPHPFFRAPPNRNAVQTSWNVTSQTCRDNDPRERDERAKYSVLVVSYGGERYTNLFQDQKRLCAFSEDAILVKVVNPMVRAPLESPSHFPPFFVGHPSGPYHRVRVLDFYTTRGRQVSHVEASCADPSEQTIVLVKDETCQQRSGPHAFRMPLACAGGMVNFFPFNGLGLQGESIIPGGVRVRKVSHTTSPRRRRLVQIARDFEREHHDLPLYANGTMMNASEYQAMLLVSKFTLCPGGHNPETFRMFEALEAGSIPIISRQDYMYPAYRAPFPCGEGDAAWNTVAGSPFAQAASVSSWEELPVVLNKLLRQSPQDLDKLQADSIRWYETLMKRTYKMMLNFGQGFEMWPQDGPIVLEGFALPTVTYGYTPSYVDEQP